jgi:hypothetical protein
MRRVAERMQKLQCSSAWGATLFISLQHPHLPKEEVGLIKIANKTKWLGFLQGEWFSVHENEAGEPCMDKNLVSGCLIPHLYETANQWHDFTSSIFHEWEWLLTRDTGIPFRMSWQQYLPRMLIDRCTKLLVSNELFSYHYSIDIRKKHFGANNQRCDRGWKNNRFFNDQRWAQFAGYTERGVELNRTTAEL